MRVEVSATDAPDHSTWPWPYDFSLNVSRKTIPRRFGGHNKTAIAAPAGPPTVFVVDDDINVRQAIRAVLEDSGRHVEDFVTSEDFLAAYQPKSQGCLLVDAHLPGIDGFELLSRLKAMGDVLPAIMITGNSAVPVAVQAMRAGVVDFIEKPVGAKELIASVERALEQSRDASRMTAWRSNASSHIADLTARQREIMDLVLAGHPSKNIASDLGISQRTVENHRASIMRRTGVKSLPAGASCARRRVERRRRPPRVDSPKSTRPEAIIGDWSKGSVMR